MPSLVYEYHSKPDVSWICCTCGLPNFSSSLFLSGNPIDVSNSFNTLDTTSGSDPGTPLLSSSPKRTKPTTNQVQHRFKVISLNLQSIRAKKPLLYNLIDSVQPDVIVGTETWLKPDIYDSEFCPPGYIVQTRRDRPDGYGGVIIMTKSTISADEVYKSDSSELAAIAVKRGKKQPLIIVGHYRPPNCNQEQAEQVCTEICTIHDAHKNSPIWITGDLNLPDVDWSTLSTKGNSNPIAVNQTYISTSIELGLQQMVDFPTRLDATLDLFLTNRPSLINKIQPLPGISDHDVIFIDSSVEVKHQRPPKRKIYLWKRADVEGLQEDFATFSNHFVQKFVNTDPVNTLWDEIKAKCLQLLDKHVPSKMTSQRFNQPWITRDLKNLSRRKKKAFKKYRQTNSTKDFEHYKLLKDKSHALCKRRHDEYVNSIIMDDDNKPKRLWSVHMSHDLAVSYVL